jgi:hypothetical protein
MWVCWRPHDAGRKRLELWSCFRKLKLGVKTEMVERVTVESAWFKAL